MNPMQGNSQRSLLDINQLHHTAMNVAENICSIIARPIELILRPFHGSRYYPPPIILFSSILMIFIPIFSSVVSTAVSMIPFTHFPAPVGIYGIGSLTEPYFLLSIVHGVRIFRRMLNPGREKHSEFEGPGLPLFHLLPGGGSFWFIRIVLEPLFVMILAVVLERTFIIQSGLATFLFFSALALSMKSYIAWYKAWEYIRNILDVQNAGPIVASLLENQATDSQLATVHLASFPKDLTPDIRHAAARHIARAFSFDEEGSK